MTVDLLIAGRRIRLQSGVGVSLEPDERFSAFTVPCGGEPDLTVDVESGRPVIPDSVIRVFDARLIEETPGGTWNTGEPFWEVMDNAEETFARVYLKNPERSPVLVIPHSSNRWKLFTDTEGGTVDPLPYPVDGLLLYFLASARGDIMIHGSGVICNGRGWLFTGRSGSGKTTLARIFDSAGDRVIHDDRLVLRPEGGRWVMHSTPVYRDDEPRSAPLDHLWAIAHGRANVSTPVSGAGAVGMVMANCIQQNWDGEAVSGLAAAVENLLSSVRVSRLSFVPGSSIRDYLAARETDGAVTAAEAATAMLAEEKPVTVTAGGYSMWPAIKPGDRVRISPPIKETIAARGSVVALRRDGGFVVHRVTDVRRDGPADQIRTRGDTSVTADPWINTRDVAGMVTLVTEEGDTIPVPPRRFPYLAGSLAATAAQIWNRITGRM